MLLFTLNYNINDIRQSLLIPSSIFTTEGRIFYLSTNSSTNGSVFNQMAIKYINDTTISASLISGVCKILYIYGIKIK